MGKALSFSLSWPNPQERRRDDRYGAAVGTELRVRLLSVGSALQLRRELFEDERGDLGRCAVVCVKDQVVGRELVEISG